MNRKPFRFKQFEIFQDQTAMKVGTDGVLLGAWANHPRPKTILDIGTGTGLVALMVAQRFLDAIIDAVELDDDAFNQAKENILNSKFKDRITIHQSAIQKYQTTQKFDLIVSNPPFFITNDRVDFDARKQARQQETLNFEDLLSKTRELLSDQGKACFIIPFDLEANFLKIAADLNLFPDKIIQVKGNSTTDFKRSLISLQAENNKCEYSSLVIELERHQYTTDYINLTKEFYLKM